MSELKITSTLPAEFDLALETGAKFAVLAIVELKSEACYCGARKASLQTFCRREYYSLPVRMRHALYNRIGQGYEEAYQAARKYLFEKAKGKGKGKEESR